MSTISTAAVPATVSGKKRMPVGFKAATIESKPVFNSTVSYEGVELFQALLVLPKDPVNYPIVCQRLLILAKRGNWLKNHLEILFDCKVLSSLSPSQLANLNLPHLFDETMDTPKYAHCLQILHELADLGKLTEEVLYYFKFLAKDAQQEPRLRLITTSVLIQNFYGSALAKIWLGEEKQHVKAAIKHFLRVERPDSDGTIPSDLLCPLEVLREFLYHSDRSLRLQARSITEASQIPLELPAMISLSIDGIQAKAELDDLIFVIGITGSGKSTLINVLSGIKYKLDKIPSTGTYYLQPKAGENIPVRVGHGAKSQTLYPEVIQREVSYNEVCQREDGTEYEEVKHTIFSFADTPGFEDSRGDEEAICAALGVPLGIHYAKKIRAIIVVFEWSSTDINSGGRAREFRLLSKTLSGILNKPRGLLNINPDGRPDPFPIPLLFAISKPPFPRVGEHFNPEELKSQMINRIRVIQTGSADRFASIPTEEKEVEATRRKLADLEFCLGELDNFENVKPEQQSKVARRLFGYIAEIFQESEVLTQGYIEQRVSEQASRWLEENMPLGSIEMLSGVLRQYMSTEKAERATLIENKRVLWEAEKERLRVKVEEQATRLEELQGEQEVLELIALRSDNIFIIRGFEEEVENSQNLPDHRNELLAYLSCLRDNNTEIARESFAFKASSSNFDKVRRWADDFAQEVSPVFAGLLELPREILKYDRKITEKGAEIESKKELLRASFLPDFSRVQQAFLDEIQRQQNMLDAIDIERGGLLRDKLFCELEIANIEQAEVIEYGSRRKVEERSWFGRVFKVQTYWSYNFPGKYPKTTVANQNRGWFDWFFDYYPDGHDVIPIQKVELSCLLDRTGKLVFKSPVSNNSIYHGDNLSVYSVDNNLLVKSVQASFDARVNFVEPRVTQNSLMRTGVFQIEDCNLDAGRFGLKYYSTAGENGHAAVRFFVLPKHLPEYRQRQAEFQEQIFRINSEDEALALETTAIENALALNKHKLDLITRGIYNQKEKLDTVKVLIRELGYDEQTFLNDYLPSIPVGDIEWILKTGSLDILIEFLGSSDIQAQNLRVDRSFLCGFINGTLSQNTNARPLSEDCFKENLKKLPVNFFPRMYNDAVRNTGLSLVALIEVFTFLRSCGTSSALSLQQQLDNLEFRNDQNRYFLEALKAFYRDRVLKINTLNTVISLLKYTNSITVDAYKSQHQKVEKTGIFHEFCLNLDWLHDRVVQSISEQYWEVWNRYGMTVDRMKIYAGIHRAEDVNLVSGKSSSLLDSQQLLSSSGSVTMLKQYQHPTNKFGLKEAQVVPAVTMGGLMLSSQATALGATLVIAQAPAASNNDTVVSPPAKKAAVFKTRQKPQSLVEPAQSTMEAMVANKHLLSETAWAVSLVRRKTTEHAFLVIEGKREGNYTIFRTDLFLDCDQREKVVASFPGVMKDLIGQLWRFSESSSGTAFVRLKELNIQELEDLVDSCEYQGWGLTTEDAEKLFNRIIREANDPSKTYNKLGIKGFSSSSSHSNYHNCISWCQMVLEEELGVSLGTRWELIQRPSEIVKRAIELEKAKAAITTGVTASETNPQTITKPVLFSQREEPRIKPAATLENRVVIYVWKPTIEGEEATATEVLDAIKQARKQREYVDVNVGHVTVAMPHRYATVWPAEATGGNRHKVVEAVYSDLQRDIVSEGCVPQTIITLYSLDTVAMEAAFQQIQESSSGFMLVGDSSLTLTTQEQRPAYNCNGLVYALLQKGGVDKITPFSSDSRFLDYISPDKFDTYVKELKEKELAMYPETLEYEKLPDEYSPVTQGSRFSSAFRNHY